VITIRKAPAWLAVQDLGWRGHRAIGLPPGGAMDPWALALANLVAGNSPDAAGLEWALGPGAIRFEEPARFAMAGVAARARLNDEPVSLHTAWTARAGDLLSIDALEGGRFLYLAVHGGIDVPAVLGARSTYLRARLGGLHGRLLRTEDYLRTGPARGPAPPAGFAVPGALLRDESRRTLRITLGPQGELFGPEEQERLAAGEWVVAAASDRMGYRLKGTPINPGVTASAASDPTCPGAIQVPDDGGPIVLMPDGPTVGGYPKVGVVCAVDLPVLAQRQPGDRIRFAWIPIEEAQRLYRRQRVDLHTLDTLAKAAAASGQ
jgi:antagonist of KipI